ncbi:MAG TPA: SWIB/MDM2 domain-containing protein [Thermoanaerobaculia bacterium]|jgi:upstream activation factor subunit UAF30|nr:SWIB/MDM2 domain-containing protein [Thermoanaerobaculia bacterium]
MAEKKSSGASKAGASKKAGGSKGGAANSAFMAPLTPDATLAAVVGKDPLPRTEVTKRVWDYIREHNLQDPKDKRTIKADAKLKAVFDGKDSVSMFELTKLVNSHLKKG